MEPEKVGSITELQVVANTAMIGKLVKDVQRGVKPPKHGFIEMANAAGRMNAQLFLCAHTHIEKPIIQQVHGYLRELYALASQEGDPMPIHERIYHLLWFIRKAVPHVTDKPIFNGEIKCQICRIATMEEWATWRPQLIGK